MEFFSTRGGDEKLSFEQAVLRGLAPNGGLYIPTSIPQLPSNWQTEWSNLSFSELAFQLLSLYISSDPSKGGIPSNDLKSLVDKSYSTFRSPKVAPLTQLSPNEWCLELWHGPTFAFKDVALQLLGNLFEYFLKRRNEGKKEGEERERLTVLGATSGDTGSAAIAGLRSKKDINIFILHPKGRVSPIQEAQMTTVLDANVHNVAVEGTFDDCQDIVKACFSDPEFNARHRLGAINSINIARILAQITYYFSSYFELKRQLGSQGIKDLKAEDLQYVVPTGNFGDILAGYYAKRMGLPVRNLVVATNENDILERFWKSGAYEKSSTSSTPASNGQTEVVEGSSDGSQAQPEPSAKKSLTGSTDAGGVKATLSPAMDILVSSNFERLLWYLAFEAQGNKEPEKAGERLNNWMKNLKENGRMEVNQEELKLARRDFLAERVSDEETSKTILRYFTSPPSSEHQKSYLVDPHTAVGLEAATRTAKINPPSVHRVILSTAHPAKFSEAVTTSLESSKVPFNFEKDVLPKEMIGLLEKEKRVLFVGKNKEKPGLEGLIENTRKVVEEKVGGVSKDSNGINGTQSI